MNISMYIETVSKAKELAYAPYSNFRVGALIVTIDDEIFTGCNVENSSYGLTLCAERIALFKAISEGKKEFKELYIATDSDKFCPPCGACRQVLWELAGNIKLYFINKFGEYKIEMLADLLPNPFDNNFLEDK